MPECHTAIFRRADGKCVFECEEGGEELDPYEVLYSLKKNKAAAKTPEGALFSSWFNALRLYSTCDPRAWIMFSVYYDLRERGRILKTGPLTNSFTMYKGARPHALIIVLEETVKFDVEEIFKWIEMARKMGRDCILAVVDKHGDVSYYQLEAANLGELYSD